MYSFQEKFNSSFQKIKFPPNLILLGYRGSIAHGTFVPSHNPKSIDDKDLMGVFVAPMEHYIGLTKTKETVESFIDEWDVVCYEVKKFVNLLTKSNPNVLSLLWCENKHIIYYNRLGKMLRDNRKKFITKTAYDPFAGYATSQLRRMSSHENAYQGYMGAKRKMLVDKFGYDTKNASHLVRLLIMAKEYLKTGELQIYRDKDAQFFIDVKNGKYSKTEITVMAEALFSSLKKVYEESKLPENVDRDSIEKMLMRIIMETHKL